MTRDSSARGYTLIVVIILLAVLMVLGAGAIRMATAEVDAAAGHRRQVSLAECARAARQVLVGQLQFMHPIPQHFSLQVKDPSTGDVVVDVAEGHDPSAPVAQDQDGNPIAAVEFMNPATVGGARMPTLHPQITNDILPPGQTGSAAARVVARCRDRVGRTREVEFQIMYGIGS